MGYTSLTFVQRCPALAATKFTIGSRSLKSVLEDRVDRPVDLHDRSLRERPQLSARRVLILTSSLGSGHVRGGQAIAAALEDKYPEVEVRSIDFWSLMDGTVADAAKQSYLDLVEGYSHNYQKIFELDGGGIQSVMHRQVNLNPVLAEGFGKLAERKLEREPSEADAIRSTIDRALYRLLRWGFPGRRPDTRWALLARQVAIFMGQWRIAQRLRENLNDFRPESIVVTQPLPAALLALLKRRETIDVPVIGVLTNWGVIEFYAQSAIDYYCVPNGTIPGLKQLEPFSVTGCPLMPGFRMPPSRGESRMKLGLDPEKPVVVVQGGGLGIHTTELARTLLGGTDRVQVLVQAGSNKRALEKLRAMSCEFGERLKVSEWTDEMYLALSAADVVVGKPGGLTLAECLACGRPLLAVGSTGGQETMNVKFLEQEGVGWEVTEDEVVEAVISLLQDGDKLRQIEQRAFSIGERAGAERVADLVATHQFDALLHEQ